MVLDTNKQPNDPVAYNEWNQVAVAVNNLEFTEYLTEAPIDGIRYTRKDAAWEGLPSILLSNIIEDTTPELGGELDANANSIGFTLQSIISTAGNATIDFKLGNHANITLTENTTFTFTAPSNTQCMTLLITQDTIDRTITLPAITWLGDPVIIKTGSGAVTMIVLRHDGTTWIGDWK